MRKTIIAGLLAALTLPAMAADAQSAREVRHDNRELHRDQRQYHRAVANGNYGRARDERRDIRDDRQERREDWRDYRRAHGDVFRRGAYVGPRGYRYRAVVPGYRFAPAYYGQRYWISDYGRYRLPQPVYGYRWIRYGNDAVMVNARTGVVRLRFGGVFF